jgi:hypothetical protein
MARASVRGLPGERWLARREGAGVAVAIVSLAVVAAALALRRRRGRLGPSSSESREAGDAFALLALFALLHYAAYALWLWSAGEEEYRRYYFMPQTMLMAAALGTVLGSWLERALRRPAARWSAVALGILPLALYLFSQASARLEASPAEPGPVAERHIYGWVARTIPPGAVLGAHDAGKLGYFTGHPVVNLDGLINDDRLLAAIRDDRVDDYIYRSPIQYLFYDRPWLGGFDPSRPDLPPRAHGGIGEILYRLAHRPGCALREVPGATHDWVVIEVVRTPATLR